MSQNHQWVISLKSDAGIMIQNPPGEKEFRYQYDTWGISTPRMARAIARKLVEAARAWENNQKFKRVKLSLSGESKSGKPLDKFIVKVESFPE